MDKQDPSLRQVPSPDCQLWLQRMGILRGFYPSEKDFYFEERQQLILVSFCKCQCALELLKDQMPTWWNYGKRFVPLTVLWVMLLNFIVLFLAFKQGSLLRGSTYNYNYIDTSIGNESIKPETKYEFEIGLENKFFNNRLGMEFNFYSNTIKDQILQTTSAASMGC